MSLEYGSYIPIFVISHDKVDQLKKVIDSYDKNIKTPKKIFVFNHNTTYEPCLEYYKELELKGIHTFHAYEECNSYKAVNRSRDRNLLKIMRQFLDENKDVNYVVITDCDVELCPSDGNILDFYIKNIKEIGSTDTCIGPSLRIDDIPNFYPNKKQIIKRHSVLYNVKEKRHIEYEGKTITLHRNAIDTTFKIIHRDNVYKIKKDICTGPQTSWRCDTPYNAWHLDWYEDPDKFGEDIIYYKNNALNNHSFKPM